jgi:peptidoglycan/xylan/chitin deacetylase (PgdA/CDA1 family)
VGRLEQSLLSEERLNAKPHISPTFDDGPDPVWTPKILSELRSVGAKATFFVVAPLALRFPDIVRRTMREGHEIALHCSRHIRHTELTREEVEEDTERGLRSLEEIGISPHLWRPPWGILAPWTEDVADYFGLEISLWDADTHDWRGDSAEEMLASVGPSLSPGDTILMHDGLGPGATRDGCEESARLVAPLAARIREIGCEPSPLAAKTPRRAKV